MGANGLDEYWVPEHVKDYLRKLGFVLPLDDMEPWIRSWDDWMSARGEFYDYRDKDGMGRVYEVHRSSIYPAMRVCKEWGSLLLNEEVKVVCEDQRATDWINAFLSSNERMAHGVVGMFDDLAASDGLTMPLRCWMTRDFCSKGSMK